MKKFFSKEVIIGLLVILALALLFGGIEFLKGVDVFEKENTYTISYENVQGLAVSAPVTVNGFKVGQVRSISYEYDNPGHVRVDIEIADELRLPLGTTAVLSSDLLGTASITLQLTKEKDFYPSGSQIPGVIPSGMLDMVSNQLLPAVNEVFPKVDTLLTNANDVISDPNIKSALSNASSSMANINQLTKDLNKVSASITTLANDLLATANQIHGIVGTLPPVVADVKNITGSFVDTSAKINSLATNLSDMPIDSLVNTIQSTIANLQDMTNQLKGDLRNPNSTIGKLLNDPALYNNLNASVQSLDSLLTDIKKNPKRYISIKLL